MSSKHRERWSPIPGAGALTGGRKADTLSAMNRRGYIAITILVLAAATAVALVLTLDRPSSAPGGRSSAKYVIALDAGHGGKGKAASEANDTGWRVRR